MHGYDWTLLAFYLPSLWWSSSMCFIRRTLKLYLLWTYGCEPPKFSFCSLCLGMFEDETSVYGSFDWVIENSFRFLDIFINALVNEMQMRYIFWGFNILRGRGWTGHILKYQGGQAVRLTFFFLDLLGPFVLRTILLGIFIINVSRLDLWPLLQCNDVCEKTWLIFSFSDGKEVEGFMAEIREWEERNLRVSMLVSSWVSWYYQRLAYLYISSMRVNLIKQTWCILVNFENQ